ncbi:MAG: adenylyltransferase/cytidyltransferase family protein [Sulfitobacter sp.]
MINLTRRPTRVVLTYGRFDLFHQGHVNFLRRLAQTGDELIVGCTTDALAVQMQAPCQMSFDTRRALLESCRFVSRVIPETDLNQKRTDIVNYNACALAMGEDRFGAFDSLQDIAQVLYLPRHAGRQAPKNAAQKQPQAALG